LKLLADEQRPMSGKELSAFEAENGLNTAETSALLGIAERTVRAYRHEKVLPATVAITLRAMRANKALLAAHYRPIPRSMGRPRKSALHNFGRIHTPAHCHRSDLHHVELRLLEPAGRAREIVRDVFPARAGRYAVVGQAVGFVVDEAAIQAFPGSQASAHQRNSAQNRWMRLQASSNAAFEVA